MFPLRVLGVPRIYYSVYVLTTGRVWHSRFFCCMMFHLEQPKKYSLVLFSYMTAAAVAMYIISEFTKTHLLLLLACDIIVNRECDLPTNPTYSHNLFALNLQHTCWLW